ncbi:MAG: alpha/beta fold hydrolase [Roseovarius sp.]
MIFLLVAVVAACAPRNVAKFGAPNPDATVHRIYVATEHRLDNLGPIFGEPRPRGMRFLHVDVSVPPTHEMGAVEWPEGEPDAATDFVAVGSNVYKNPQQMISAMRRGVTSNETLVFVHGYNNTFSDALFRFAQIREDFGVTDPSVLFAWPSAGDPRGYAYDRDSVLYSRDDFEAVLEMLTRGDNRVVLLAHSMGTHLVMETFRQIALKGNRRILDRINGVVLMSPDIDPDVFRRQTDTIGKLPQPFLIFTSQQDRALSLSSFITGRKPRLGVISDRSQLEGIEGVGVIDFTKLSDGEGLNHSTAISSPAAIKILRGMTEQAENNVPDFDDYMVLDADL